MDLSEFTADQFHIVPEAAVKAGRLFSEDIEGAVALETDYDLWVLEVKSKHQGGRMTKFSLHFRNAVLGTRKVYQGPIEHEDYAYMVALPTVISAHPQRQPVYHQAKVGDVVIFAGHIWQIREDKALHDPYLEMVS